jgi:hypothetical protein
MPKGSLLVECSLKAPLFYLPDMPWKLKAVRHILLTTVIVSSDSCCSQSIIIHAYQVQYSIVDIGKFVITHPSNELSLFSVQITDSYSNGSPSLNKICSYSTVT